MATIRVTIQQNGSAFTGATPVLRDPDGVFGVRQGDDGAVVVAAGTAMTPAGGGVYVHEWTVPVAGISYAYWIAVADGPETHYTRGVYVSDPADITITISEHDAALLAAVAQQLAAFGEPVIVYPPSGSARSVTGIVTRSAPAQSNDPRGIRTPMTVQLPNDATAGIGGNEWTNRFEIGVPRYRGGPTVRLRTTRPVHQDLGMMTWEVT